MKRFTITMTAILIAILSVVSVNAASLDPITGKLSHTYIDRESSTFVGILQFQDRTYGISFNTGDYAATPSEAFSTDVFTVTTDTIAFMQSDILYTANVVNNLTYNGELSNLHYYRYPDGGECNIFTLSIVETNESLIVCLDPTDTVNATNGLTSIMFGNAEGAWDGTLYQNDAAYPFRALDKDPGKTYVINLPFVASR